MTIWIGLLAAGLALSQAASPPTAPAAADNVQPQRRVIFFSAVDHSGNPLQNISKDQLSIIDNNIAGQVLEVRNANELPLHLAIVLLCSRTNFENQQKAAIELARKVTRPNIDKVFVLTAGGEKIWQNNRVDWQMDP